jgi:2-dehydro-3-deoxy-D-gluconate 5-dehydrogenase
MLNFRTDDKIALVTGCNRGIGMAIAIELAQSGADIIGVSNNMPESGSDVEKAVQAAGKKFYPYTADFTNRPSLYGFLNKVTADHPRIDILINNAGHIMRKPAAEHPDEYWDAIIDINLNAQFIITREIGKQMLEHKYGKIVFTCSLLSFQGGINVPGYAASKGAISSLLTASRSMAWRQVTSPRTIPPLCGPTPTEAPPSFPAYLPTAGARLMI